MNIRKYSVIDCAIIPILFKFIRSSLTKINQNIARFIRNANLTK